MRVQLAGNVRRDAQSIVQALITEEPAIILEGARGSGKTTLMRSLADSEALVLDFDDAPTLAYVKTDPVGALQHSGLVIIDEFQLLPEVLSTVKKAVDNEPVPGKFLLAGSVSTRVLNSRTETLTGRAHRFALDPLSVGEILGASQRLLPKLIEHQECPSTQSQLSRRDYFDLVVAGGYPGALLRQTPTSRQRWFESYLGTVAARDLPQTAAIRNPGAMLRFYRAIAEQTANLITLSQFATALDVSRVTARNYLDLLESIYLVSELPGWSASVSAKSSRRPKIHVTDTGLGVSILRMDAAQLSRTSLAGGLLESFVLGELKKQAILVDQPLQFAYFRDRSGVEVDIIVELYNGDVIAFEVKSATSINEADVRGLKFLRDRLGKRLVAGVLLYTGEFTAAMGEQIWATPISALWGGESSDASR